MALGSIQPPAEISIRNLSRGKGRPDPKAYNASKLGSFFIPMGLDGLLQGYIFFLFLSLLHELNFELQILKWKNIEKCLLIP
jgi:hypothetical protein